MNRVDGRPEPTARQRDQQRKNEALAKRVFGVLTVAEFLKTQFTSEEDVLDIPERWPRFRFDAHAEVKRIS